jgi:hypothetical protein
LKSLDPNQLSRRRDSFSIHSMKLDWITIAGCASIALSVLILIVLFKM